MLCELWGSLHIAITTSRGIIQTVCTKTYICIYIPTSLRQTGIISLSGTVSALHCNLIWYDDSTKFGFYISCAWSSREYYFSRLLISSLILEKSIGWFLYTWSLRIGDIRNTESGNVLTVIFCIVWIIWAHASPHTASTDEIPGIRNADRKSERIFFPSCACMRAHFVKIFTDTTYFRVAQVI